METEQSSSKQIMVVSAPDHRAVCFLLCHPQCVAASAFDCVQRNGKMTAGYFLYAAIGPLFSTPTPFAAVLVISLFIEKTGIRPMFRYIFRTENKLKTILITVGIAEETGWRGVLQPELDKRLPYPFSVLLTAAIWFVWHFPVFLDPTSNHYGDSIVGFGITIFIWAFALAAIYKSTKK